MLKVKLILLVLVVACQTLHLGHQQTINQYNATNYLQDLQSRQQKFVTDVNLIKKQIDDMNTVLNSSTLTIDDQLAAMSEGMADERDSLYNIETYLDLPFEIQPCKQVNLTTQQRQALQKQIDVVRTSLDDLETQASTCPQCPQIAFIQQQIKKNYNYLRAIEATVHSNCLRIPYLFIQQSSTGLVDLSNSFYKDNLKAKNWIYGNITQQQYKMHIFSLSTQYNLTSCPLNRPYVDPTQKICIICRGLYNIGQRKCYPCPEGQHYNFITSKCQQNPTCPPNTILNTTTGKCLLLPSNQNPICPPGQTLNTTTNKCEVSTPICLPGQFYNITTKKCEISPIPCDSGYLYNQATRRCQIIVCQQGTIYDPISKICVKKVEGTMGLCPPERPIWNQVARRCQLCPTSAPVFNRLTRVCQSCPAGATWNSIVGQCQIKCPEGQILNLVNKTCQSICLARQTYNLTSKSCEYQCPSGQFYNSTSSACQIQCKQGELYDTTTKTCQSQCKQGQVYNSNTKTCQSECRQGQVYNSGTKTCQITCTEGTQYDVVTKKCQPICQEGFVYNSTTKMCSNVCKANFYWDSVKKSCFCSPGLYLINNQCVPKVTCFYPNPVWVQSNNSCIACPTSTPVYINETCTNCPSDRPNFAQKIGVCLQPCPIGYLWNQTIARCDMIICSGDKPFLNFAKGVCQGCPAGFTWQATTKTCKSGLGDCPIDRPFYNQGSKACQQCPFESVYNPTLKQCEYCPQSFRRDPVTTQCIVIQTCKTNPSLCPTCPDSYYYDQNIQKCVKNTCDPGYFFNSASGYCEKCQAGFVYDTVSKRCLKILCANGIHNPLTNRCQSCPTGTKPSLDQNSCINSCASGEYYSPLTTACVRCSTGQYFNTATYQCSTCPPGTSFDSTLNACTGSSTTTCPSGTSYNQVTKTCESVSCGDSSYLDPITSKCVAYPICNWDQVLDKPTRTCRMLVCPSGYTLDKSTVKCISVSSYSYVTSPNATNLIYYFAISQYQKQYNQAKLTNPNIKDCPKQSPYYDKNNKVCVSCPSNLPYFNLHTSLCQDCGNSKYLSDQRKCQSQGGANLNPTLQRLIMNIL